MTPPRFTPEQRAAIDDRRGSRLLAANAGSGKTAVLVERFVEAVLVDEVPVGAVLAITFTEKAAAELRERTRGRFLELEAPQAARATDTAWIGTIHGFCARVLRAAPLAAGVDPGFRVLDEAEAQRLAVRAYDAALDGWAAASGSPALDLAAAYGEGLRDLVLGAHASLRAGGQRRPALPVPPLVQPPDPGPLRAACAAAAAHLKGADGGKRVGDGLLALEACARALEGVGDAVPLPSTIAAGALGRGGKALDAEPAAAYRSAWAAYRGACADHHARPALALLDALLGRFADRYDAAKRDRAGLDFDDLELAVRDLLASDPAARRRWAERFALIMVDEFQDTNRLQLGLLEALERDNLFAVGDELQSIYAFRHADVEIFRARHAALGAGRVRRLRTNFRSAPEVLDVLNAAFAPVFGASFAPLEPGRTLAPTLVAVVAPSDPGRSSAPTARPSLEPRRAPAPDELRLFDPDDVTVPVPPVELPLDAGDVSATEPPVELPLDAGDVSATEPVELPLDAGDVSAAEPPVELPLDAGDVSATEPPVELLLTDTRGWDEPELVARLGLAGPGTTPARRAEARLLAQRVREEVDAGRRPGDVVVLVRATASLRLFEAAFEEQGLATFVLGGRGYWSDEQVRDGLAYLAALANPRDERALYAVLASPFCGVGSDALILLAEAGRQCGGGAWAALLAAVAPIEGPARLAGPPRGAPSEPGDEPPPGAPPHLHAVLPPAEWGRLSRFAQFFAAERARAEREPIEALLERAIVATGYDLAVLRRSGGERRLANLRKLMRLAREHERAEGRDLRAFVAYAQGQDVAQAREGEAALESEGLDAIRLMTIHRAKGLEFPVVCVADLGRAGSTARPALLVSDDGRVGLRLRALGSGESVPALDHEALAEELGAAEVEEEQRLLYVAATRARERLLLSGTLDLGKAPKGIARPGGPPLDWLAPALLGPSDVAASAERLSRPAEASDDCARQRAHTSDESARRGVHTSVDSAQQCAHASDDPAWERAHTRVDSARQRAHTSDDPARQRARASDDRAPQAADMTIDRAWQGRSARVRIRLNAPSTIGRVLTEAGLTPRPAAGTSAGTAHAAVLRASGAAPASRGQEDGEPAREEWSPGELIPVTAMKRDRVPVLSRLSHSALREHARCGYRFYLRRVLRLPPVEPPAPPSATRQEGTVGGRLDARARGTLVHLLLERLDLRRPVVPTARAVLALATVHGLEATEGDADEAREVLRAFAGSPLRKRLASATRVQREAPFAYALEPGGGGARMTGAVDVLARERDGTALVVDYKTDRLAGREPAAVVVQEYETQRVIYALAALRDGAPRVEVAHVFLERPGAPVLAAFAAADAPALAERLLALADDALAGRYPVTLHPHRELCGDCPGRGALCSWPESRTLREPGGEESDDLRRAA